MIFKDDFWIDSSYISKSAAIQGAPRPGPYHAKEDPYEGWNPWRPVEATPDAVVSQACNIRFVARSDLDRQSEDLTCYYVKAECFFS